MRRILIPIFGIIFSLVGSRAMASSLENTNELSAKMQNIQVGPRPYFLIDDMDPGALKTTLKQCSEIPLRKTDFSIGHRGAALQFPEHTKESYEAAARMSAGIRRMRRDLYQGQATGVSSLAMRSAHHDEHPGHNLSEKMFPRLYAGGV
jgi:hypothetical protein